ncbi:MAG: hypothetical protein ACK56F_14860, partial [bacterium]
LYVRPLTLAESQKIQQSVKADNVVDALITTLIVRARNADGQPVFKLAQKSEILHSVDPDVVCRIVTGMNKTEEDYEALEKKSLAHPVHQLGILTLIAAAVKQSFYTEFLEMGDIWLCSKHQD